MTMIDAATMALIKEACDALPPNTAGFEPSYPGECLSPRQFVSAYIAKGVPEPKPAITGKPPEPPNMALILAIEDGIRYRAIEDVIARVSGYEYSEVN